MSGPTSTYALAAAEESSPWQQESRAEGCERWPTQVREQITPRALTHNKGRFELRQHQRTGMETLAR